MQLLTRFNRRLQNLSSGSESNQSKFIRRILSITARQKLRPMAEGEKFITLGEDYLNKFDEIVIIGDIHGCSDEFEEVLEKIHKETPSKKADKVLKIIVGDLVNKGPNSKRVLQICCEKYPNSILSVKGNHDELVIRLFNSLKDSNKTTELSKKNKWIERLPGKYVSYLQKLPYSITIPSLNCIIVHAGIDPSKDKPAIETSLDNLVTMRNIEVLKDNSGKNYYNCTKENKGAPWATFWPGPEHVYFGHDAKRRLQSDHEFATGLDTGCVYGDRLSYTYLKYMTEEKNGIFSVKAKKIYESVKGDLIVGQTDE